MGSTMTSNGPGKVANGLLSVAARIAGTPLRGWGANRRRFRRFLAFSAIDSHTLDDIGLRRSIFTAASSDDKFHTKAGCAAC